jgi:hypothetical protein
MRAAKELIEKGSEIIENSKEVIEERKELVEDLFEKAEEYVKTNIQLAKLKATDKVADVVGSVVTQLSLVIFGFFFLLMLNIGIAFWLGDVLGQIFLGFLIVSGFYALLGVLVFAFRKSIIKTPISNAIISQILK